MKRILSWILIVAILLGLLLLGLGLHSWYQQKNFAFRYFSDSLEIDEAFQELLERERYLANIERNSITAELVEFTPPEDPLLLRMRTEAFLKQARSLADQRTDELVEIHEAEYHDLLAIPVGEGLLGDYIGVDAHPLTHEFFKLLDNDLGVLIAVEKVVNNVGRPMQFDLSVNSPVETPGSPSYPSLFAARSQLAVEVLRQFLNDEELAVVEAAVDAAQLRKEIVGVSSMFDIAYGEAYAQTFYQRVMDTEPYIDEFIAYVERHEYETNTPVLVHTGPLPDVILREPAFLSGQNQTTFSTELQNIGSVPVWATSTPMFELEIDRFADGVVDEVIPISYGVVIPGLELVVSHTNIYRWPGDHQFRFVANPYYSFPEIWHHNNFGAWTPFSI